MVVEGVNFITKLQLQKNISFKILNSSFKIISQYNSLEEWSIGYWIWWQSNCEFSSYIEVSIVSCGPDNT